MKKIINFSLKNLGYNAKTLDKDNVTVEIDYKFVVDYTDLVATSNNLKFLPGDKIYFLPGVNIPRVKLKNILLDYNASVVRNISQATKIIVGRASLSKISTTTYSYNINLNDLKLFSQLLIDNDSLDGYELEKLKFLIDDPTEYDVIVDYTTKNFLTNPDLDIYNSVNFSLPESFKEASYNSFYKSVIDNDYTEIAEYIYENNLDLYDESEVLDQINGDDALIIDKETYEKIANMFDSSDTENHTVAMELMSNSQYRESLYYLELLFHNYYNEMYTNYSKSHVNFKSLLSYLGKSSRSFHTDINDIMDSLVKKKEITVEHLDIILNDFKGSIIHDNKYFKVKSVTIDSEIFDIIKEDYVRQVFKDREIEIEIVEETILDDQENTPQQFSWI